MRGAKEKNNSDGPKERILMAASDVFIEQGFAQGTTREIARRAGANVAAISYHFGSKEQLYVFVLNYWKQRMFKKLSLDKMQDETMLPEERLKIYVRSMLETALDEKTSLWFGKMIARELMLEPSSALASFLSDDLKIVSQSLQEILWALCGEGADPESVNLCVASVLGQCTFFASNRPVLQTIFMLRPLDWENIDVFVEHIVRFTLRAIATIKADVC